MGDAVEIEAYEPDVQTHAFGANQEWDLPIESAFLREFLTHVFSTYWADIVWGPLIDGASYELTCPRAPTVDFSNDYLTIDFGGPHFHLCLGVANPRPDDATAARRSPGKAWIFRQLDAAGAPISWGFGMKNGAGEPMLTIFFANPFVTAATVLEREAKWERLAMWRDISHRYLGRAPEAFDESGRGYMDRPA